MEKFKAQPDILIQVKGMGFTFLVDTSYKHKHNLLTPCFVDFLYKEYPASQERIESHEWLNLNFPTPEDPIKTPLYPFTDVFKRKQGIRKIKGKDGINRGCGSATLKFEHNGKTYSELFYIDQSLCSYCNSKKKMFSGVLGIDFLKKHKWIIDFNKLEINT